MSEQYDMVILGAGINGVAIAKALAHLGKKVLIVEKTHIAAGASSKSSRLIHGGLRYLENFEFFLVKEVYIGTRPIIKSKKDVTKMSREFKLDLQKIGKNKVLHVYGGKLTSFPSLARKVLKVLDLI